MPTCSATLQVQGPQLQELAVGKIQQQLIQDHQHLERVLGYITEVVGNKQIDDLRQIDLSFVLDCLDYISDYLEIFHHPLEECVIALLHAVDSDPVLTTGLTRITGQHNYLERRTRWLQDQFRRITEQEPVEANTVLRNFRHFCQLQSEHLHFENERLIPAVETHLTQEQLLSVERDFQQRRGSEAKQRQLETIYLAILDRHLALQKLCHEDPPDLFRA